MPKYPVPKSVVVFEKDLKPITYPGIEPNRYMISTNGDVLDLEKNKFLTRYTPQKKYDFVICKLSNPYVSNKGNIVTSKRFTVHRLTAYEHCPNADLNKTVDHIDENKSNNYYTNLEWVSLSENIQRNMDKGNRKSKEKYIPPKHNVDEIYHDASNQRPSDEQLHNVAKLLQNSDYKVPYTKICEDAGIYNICRTRANSICGDMLSGRKFKSISKEYDLSYRKEHQKHLYSEEYKNKIKSYWNKNQDATYSQIYNATERKKWEDQTEEEKARFRQIVTRVKNSNK